MKCQPLDRASHPREERSGRWRETPHRQLEAGWLFHVFISHWRSIKYDWPCLGSILWTCLPAYVCVCVLIQDSDRAREPSISVLGKRCLLSPPSWLYSQVFYYTFVGYVSYLTASEAALQEHFFFFSFFFSTYFNLRRECLISPPFSAQEREAAYFLFSLLGAQLRG